MYPFRLVYSLLTDGVHNGIMLAAGYVKQTVWLENSTNSSEAVSITGHKKFSVCSSEYSHPRILEELFSVKSVHESNEPYPRCWFGRQRGFYGGGSSLFI